MRNKILYITMCNGTKYFYLPLPNKYLECGYKGLVFVEIDESWIIKNVDI